MKPGMTHASFFEGLHHRPWAAVVAAAVMLVARKPWALLTPQLWAEDGSVFLTQNDAWGARAILAPFQGYLHLLPRLTAWAASQLVDVASWPMFYNLTALLVTVGLFARLASPRVNLPGKPWLILAFTLIAQTGEVLLNLTNLQWLTAFFLILQLFTTRPVTLIERSTDLVVLVVVGLTGPFSLLLLPLFVWQWWRDQNGDKLAVLVAVGACAVVQGGLILTHPIPPDPSLPPSHWPMLLAVLGSRLVVWPWLGSTIAAALPATALILVGCGGLLAVVGWSLRDDAVRTPRLQVVMALAVLAVAGLWRVRPDTWETANLDNGDRYFFIPRVLLAWLVVWEFDCRRHIIALIARGLGLAAIALVLPHYRLPAPPDYRWAERCDPIRRGVPAKIPTLPAGWTLEYPGRPHSG